MQTDTNKRFRGQQTNLTKIKDKKNDKTLYNDNNAMNNFGT